MEQEQQGAAYAPKGPLTAYQRQMLAERAAKLEQPQGATATGDDDDGGGPPPPPPPPPASEPNGAYAGDAGFVVPPPPPPPPPVSAEPGGTGQQDPSATSQQPTELDQNAFMDMTPEQQAAYMEQWQQWQYYQQYYQYGGGQVCMHGAQCASLLHVRPADAQGMFDVCVCITHACTGAAAAWA